MTPPRTQATLATVLGIVLALTVVAHGAEPRALSYVDCSQGLLDQPAWESGDTEFEMEDVNGDGHIDLVSIGDHGNPQINSDEEGLMVWLGNGAGAWSYRHAGQFGYGGVACGDLNGDGLLDVAYGMHHDYGSGDFGDGLLEAALGDGTGLAWSPWDDGLAIHGQTYGMFSTDLLDADGDGDLDLVSSSFGYGQGMHVYLNRGNGSWSRSFGYLGDNCGDLLTTGDIDGNGAPDVAAAIQSGAAWLNDGEGFLTQADGNLPVPGAFNHYEAVALGDVDGDGRDDLAFCDVDDKVQVWLARGPGAWAPALAGLPADANCQRTQLADLSGDGTVDVVVLGNARLRVLAGNGGAAWTLATDMALPDTPGYAVALRTGRDVDHNGLPDLVLVESQRAGLFETQNKVRCYRESTPAGSLSVRVVEPGPNRSLRTGARAAIDWAAAVPPGKVGTARIEFSAAGSAGPWNEVAAAQPNSGRLAWRIPSTTCVDCRVRVTVTTAGGSASAVSARFSIIRRPDPLAVRFTAQHTAAWDDGLPRERHAIYRGDWSRFLATGEYTQNPAVVTGAARFCALGPTGSIEDPFVPAPGTLAFYLATGTRVVEDGQTPGTPVAMAESTLGQDSGARMRPNAHPCPP